MNSAITVKHSAFELDNIGMHLNAMKDDQLFRVTHASLYAETTDTVLIGTEGFIASQEKDRNGDVAASLIATTPLNGLVPKGVNSDYPLVVSVCGNHFQVAAIFVSDPENLNTAINDANDFMKNNPDTALIATSEDNPYSEVCDIHIIAYLNKLPSK
jgi:hypothetical protein